MSEAAALHVETAIPNFLIHEQHSYGIKQGLRDTCVYDYLPDDHGELTVPELPGIGQEITEETMAKTWVYTSLHLDFNHAKCSMTMALSCAAISEKSRFKSSVFTLILLPLIW